MHACNIYISYVIKKANYDLLDNIMFNVSVSVVQKCTTESTTFSDCIHEKRQIIYQVRQTCGKT